MVNTCCIRHCRSRGEKGCQIRFFTFPKNPVVANEWLRHCRQDAPSLTNARVCSKHFLPTDYMRTLRHILMNESPKKIRTLKPDAVPSLELNTGKTISIPIDEYEYLQKRITELEAKLKKYERHENKTNIALERLRHIITPEQTQYLKKKTLILVSDGLPKTSL